MKTVKPHNGYIFVRPIKETKTTGGLELISKIDEQDRYSKAEVVFAEDTVQPGETILYDRSNGFGFQINDELLTVLHLGNIIGVCEE